MLSKTTHKCRFCPNNFWCLNWTSWYPLQGTHVHQSRGCEQVSDLFCILKKACFSFGAQKGPFSCLVSTTCRSFRKRAKKQFLWHCVDWYAILIMWYYASVNVEAKRYYFNCWCIKVARVPKTIFDAISCLKKVHQYFYTISIPHWIVILLVSILLNGLTFCDQLMMPHWLWNWTLCTGLQLRNTKC